MPLRLRFFRLRLDAGRWVSALRRRQPVICQNAFVKLKDEGLQLRDFSPSQTNRRIAKQSVPGLAFEESALIVSIFPSFPGKHASEGAPRAARLFETGSEYRRQHIASERFLH